MSEKQLPEGWRMVKFGDMARHISKRVEPSETDLNIYVGLEHLDPDSLRIKRHGVPSDVEGQKLLVKKGQIIFGKRRAYQRKLGVADWDCICSAHAMVLEANPKTVIPEFLPFFMLSDVFMNRAIAISEGSLSPTIKWKALERQEFALPPIKTQVIFTKIFCKIDFIEKTRHSLSGYSEQFTRIIERKFFETGIANTKSVLTKYGNIPENWELVPFGNLMSSAGTQNGLYKGKDYYGSGLPMVHMMDMFHSESLSDSKNEMQLVELDEKEIEKFTLKKDDLLFARRSLTTDGAGLCCIYQGRDSAVSFESSVIRVTLNRDKAIPEFYNIYFRSAIGRWNMKKIIQTVAASGITGTDLKNIPVPWPSLVEQEKIVQYILNSKRVIDSSFISCAGDLMKSYINSNFRM
ncbi:restriction endonuclease subunit S [Methylomonas sp. TEB]|uniref:restriction endonuclease subunit S n=1 Tax=Methylomonas sp. TEB TaxID=3398229 RepID=UPI0039F4583B